MNRLQILKASCFSVVLASTMSFFLPSLVVANSQYTKDAKQETIINLSPDALKKNYFLKINSSYGFQGKLKVNGRNIKKIRGNDIKIRLSYILKRGKNILEITGNNQSSTANLQVELIGPGTQISQSSIGDGNIKNTLVIYIE